MPQRGGKLSGFLLKGRVANGHVDFECLIFRGRFGVSLFSPVVGFSLLREDFELCFSRSPRSTPLLGSQTGRASSGVTAQQPRRSLAPIVVITRYLLLHQSRDCLGWRCSGRAIAREQSLQWPSQSLSCARHYRHAVLRSRYRRKPRQVNAGITSTGPRCALLRAGFRSR
jgi:hypothetical protein